MTDEFEKDLERQLELVQEKNQELVEELEKYKEAFKVFQEVLIKFQDAAQIAINKSYEVTK